jgi:hypothetical protein
LHGLRNYCSVSVSTDEKAHPAAVLPRVEHALFVCPAAHYAISIGLPARCVLCWVRVAALQLPCLLLPWALLWVLLLSLLPCPAHNSSSRLVTTAERLLICQQRTARVANV